MDDFFDYSAGASYPNVFVTAWAVLIELQPIFYASFAEQLITVIAFFGFSADLEAYLTQNKSSEFLTDLEAANTIGIIAHCSKHDFKFRFNY